MMTCIKPIMPGLLLALVIIASGCRAPVPVQTLPETETQISLPTSEGRFTYRIVNSFPHDLKAFTEGLACENGVLYESTAFQSSLRAVELETGNITRLYPISDEYFGEGITVWGDTIVQLTWKNKKGFVYDKTTFKLLREFSYETQGWGLTQDGASLIMSDGTATLYFLDPDTFNVTGSIEVKDKGVPVKKLNELEYIGGRIYANVWMTDNITIIDPANGNVTGWIDLSGLLQPQFKDTPVGELNGIAYDTAGSRLLVTGKCWPLLFEIELIPE